MTSQLRKFLWALIALMALSFIKINAQCSEFYGMTTKGGEFNSGCIFKTDGNGNNLNVVHNSDFIEGCFPYGALVQASNGKLYGMTSLDGLYNRGLLFEWDPTSNIYSKKIDFNGTENGSEPKGSLLMANNGLMYGMTSTGGVNNIGVLFEWDPITNSYSKKLDFEEIEKGAYPIGDLIQADNGKIYGTTLTGGATSGGVLFEWDTQTNIFVKKHDFVNSENGRNPRGSLIQASNGKLYGMTSEGGEMNYGVIFEWDIVEDTLIKIFDFNDTLGRTPSGSLIQASNGKLYGMTTAGGTNDIGVIFEWNIATAIYTKLFDFENISSGGYPRSSFIEASNNKLYGLTEGGGLNYYGVLFEWDIAANTYTKKLDFNGLENGRYPCSSLVQANNNKLYGMTYQGGGADNGVLFEWDPSLDTYTKRLAFHSAESGYLFSGSLIQGENGRLYGMSAKGGIFGCGVIFELDTSNNTYTKKIDFDGKNNGAVPKGSLIQATNGMLYGLAYGGGTSNLGVLFEWNPNNNIIIKKHEFNVSNGRQPCGSLIQADNGKLYGLTRQGGLNSDGTLINDDGVLFEYDISSNTYTKKFDFDEYVSGCYPNGSLVKANNGKLYGTTSFGGGSTGGGVLFEWDPLNDTFTRKLVFDCSTDGCLPKGDLVQAYNGKIYGLTYSGGLNNFGVLFEWDLTSNEITKKLDFNGVENGSHPIGSLIKSTSGKLLGMTSEGGINNYGVLFEWDPETNSYLKIIDFDSITNGSFPNGNLCELSDATFSEISVESCSAYTSPSGTILSNSGIYYDVILNAAGCDSVVKILLTINAIDTTVSINGSLLTSNDTFAEYQWLDCNTDYSVIIDASEQSFSPLSNGSFAVELTKGNCIDTSSCYEIANVYVLRNDLNSPILIFPNPTHGFITIKLATGFNDVSVNIRDVSMQTISSDHFDFIESLDLEIPKNNGIYFLEITFSGGKTALFKIIKY